MPASKRKPPEDQPLEGEVPPADAAPAAEAEPPLVQEEVPLEDATTPVIAVVAPTEAQPPEPPEPPPSVPGSGPGSAPVSARGVVVLVVFFFALSGLCIYSMLAFWPTQAGLTARTTTTATTTTTTTTEPEDESAAPPESEAEPEGEPQEAQPVEPPPKTVRFLWQGPWKVDIEILFFLIVGSAGALGGTVAGIRSLGIYVGSRKLTRSWIPFYLFKPLLGALLSTVMYLLLRAGLFSPSASNAQVSPYGFAAIGALVGLFSDQASEKLRRVAEELFTRPYDAPPPEHYAEPAKEEEAEKEDEEKESEKEKQEA